MSLPRIPPPILALTLALVMWPAAAEAPAPLWRTAAAVLLFLVAGAFGLPALRAFRAARTTIDPVRVDGASALVTEGIYRVTRNPMYVSLTLMLAAWALWLGGAWVWAGPFALALWLDRVQIPREERAIAALFGDAYARYRREVRRWL
jgi:protein-S-isoprenylcysteine O-methyltransferase Ste14